MHVGDTFDHPFCLSQNDLRAFAAVTGDTNPLHIDQAFAEATPFGGTVAHGMWAGAVFSRIFGTLYPGQGTVYLSQSLAFKRPMFPGHPYVAQLRVEEVYPARHIARLSTQVVHQETGKVHVDGHAEIMNKGLIN